MIDRCRNFGKFERSQVPHPVSCPAVATPPLRRSTSLCLQCHVHRLMPCTPPHVPPRRAIRSHPNPHQAGDQISTVRTSTQCWCDDKDACLANPAVRALTDRMMNVTRLPYNNAEYFQILQYEEGQFYRAHHDQQTAFWTPQARAPRAPHSHAHPKHALCAHRAHRLRTAYASTAPPPTRPPATRHAPRTTGRARLHLLRVPIGCGARRRHALHRPGHHRHAQARPRHTLAVRADQRPERGRHAHAP